MGIIRRGLAAALLAAGVASLASAPAVAQDAAGEPGTVVAVPVDGVVDPFVADHVERTIADAEDASASAVLMTIDTPGGLDSSMRQIVQAILNAEVPVICYVSPDGARAASAGTFILLACPIAAMAPATNVGAAQPVGLSGAVASSKAVNDATKYLVSIADRRGRNTSWAASAVRDAASVSASQALELDVIDLVEPDVGSLLSAVDGRTVSVGGGRDVALDLSGATIQEARLGPLVGFLHALLDPNVAFIFFWLGLALIAIEFFVPGGVAGTVGAVLFIASLVALGTLPVQLIGVGLLAASIVFFVLEVLSPGVGVPAAGGVVALLLGGWFLFDSSVPGVRVSPLVLVPVAGFATLFFLVVVRSAVALRHRGVITRDETLIGREGVVVRDLDPRGIVQVASEEWTAEGAGTAPAALRRGDRIRVVAMDGLRLRVERVEVPEPPGPAPARGPGEGRTT